MGVNMSINVIPNGFSPILLEHVERAKLCEQAALLIALTLEIPKEIAHARFKAYIATQPYSFASGYMLLRSGEKAIWDAMKNGVE